MTFAPRLDILPPAQRALWPELAAVPRSFVLYGGTAQLRSQTAFNLCMDFASKGSDALKLN